MNDGSKTPKRSTNHGLSPGPGAALTNVVKQRLTDDPLWQHHAVNGAWLCPYCLSAVRSTDGTRSGLARAIESHLNRRCTGWRGGSGTPHTAEAIAGRRSYEDIAYHAGSDPAWQVFDHDGFWYSPSSLQRVPQVRLVGGRFDSFAIQQMVNQLAQCPHYQAGVVHSLAEVTRARDAAVRVGQLLGNLRQLLQYPLWRYVDAAGQWICPFCLNHIASAVIRSEQDWDPAIERMAWHIAADCPAYVPERPEPKLEALVRQAASEPPDAPARQAIPQALRTPLPPHSNSVPRLTTPTTGTRALPPGRAEGRTAPSGIPVAPVMSPSSGARIIPEITRGDDTPIIAPISSRHSRTLNGTAPSDPVAAIEPEHAEELARATSDSDAALMWMDDVENKPQKPSGTSGRLDTERLKARAVQKNLMSEVPSIPGYRFAIRFEACHDISGDFYEFITLPDGRIGFAQGDVSGHGMHAGLIMSMAKKTLEIFAQAGKGPAETLAKVNDALVDDLGGTIFISMTYAILDPGLGNITWARAGHSPAVHYNLHSGEITEIKGKGMVVGMKKGELFRKSLEEIVTPVRAGDVFLVYTDGITETMNRQQDEYGLDLLFEVVRKHAANGPDVLLDRIMDSIRQFRGGSKADDDTTLLAMVAD